MDTKIIFDKTKSLLSSHFGVSLKDAKPWQLHEALSLTVMDEIAPLWTARECSLSGKRQAHYLSAEFLVGRLVNNNILCLGVYEELEKLFSSEGASLNDFEEIEDAALGNGGLGRLAACYLDSAATLGIPLDGYGIRYKYGLFKQKIENGFQTEYADDWQRLGDPWSVRRFDEAVRIDFAKDSVMAVPYDMPVIGYGAKTIGTLRLWQAEPISEFDFTLFNDGKYDQSVREKNRAEDISRVLYPNDNTDEGKLLRLRQQYFFSSASVKDIVRKYKMSNNDGFDNFARLKAVQLNDTHPVIAIPELIRILTTEDGLSFDKAFDIAQKTFNYTNHTIMQEALEKWSKAQLIAVVPSIYKIIEQIEKKLASFKREKKIDKTTAKNLYIIKDKTVHMANLAVFATSCTNGVAEIHSRIIKERVFADWYKVFPERFKNVTNGITQRRWLALCNRELSEMVTRLLGDSGWLTDLSRLRGLEKYADDERVLDEFISIKKAKRVQLAEYVKIHDGIELDPESVFDIQIKRLHEYKRQLLNALTILWLYYEMDAGGLKDFTKTTFIFGAKSAPGYARAKGIIKLINEVARLVDKNPRVRDKIKVVFLANYNVSYAEKLVAAADVSEQISTAGTEASGTGNMKLMLNGAVTLGTYDGANIEIVEEAGEDNNYIFGARVEELESIADSYDPKKLYKSDKKLKRVLDALINGTLNDGKTGAFKELYTSILEGASWHKPDNYYLLYDFNSYIEARLRLNTDFKDKKAMARKGFMNICGAGKFSSDRSIEEYAKEIWRINNALK